jgi:hypothetical protein
MPMIAVQRDEAHQPPVADELHCVTQDPAEPASAEALAVCDDDPVDVVTSVYCEGHNCGGHPICAPCLALARETGLVRG